MLIQEAIFPGLDGEKSEKTAEPVTRAEETQIEMTLVTETKAEPRKKAARPVAKKRR